MAGKSIIAAIKRLGRPIFTTHEIIASSGKTASTVTQSLNYLKREGMLIKVYRGVWAETGNDKASSMYTILPHLFPRGRVYVSFVSALHLYGIIEQIPQILTVASMLHTRAIKTALGVVSVHKISPSFFKGFTWYKGEGGFLIAEPEKALIDALYLSACKKRQFGHFPELHFDKKFDFKKAKRWAALIPRHNIRKNVESKLSHITELAKARL